MKATNGEPAKGMEPTLGARGRTEPDFAAMTSKCRNDLHKLIKDAKKSGIAKADLIKLVEEIFDSAPGSVDAAGARASQAELKRSTALESDLELVRRSMGV